MAVFTGWRVVDLAIVDGLRELEATTAATVGHGESPSAPLPHIVVHDVGGRGLVGGSASPHEMAVLHKQVNCIDDAPWKANAIRDLVMQRMLGGGFTADGFQIAFVELVVPVGVLRDDSTADRPLYLSRDRFAVHAAPA